MKKLFISVPMRGRTEENIRATYEKLHEIAEAIAGEKLERIDTYVVDNPPKSKCDSIWYLSKSIEKMKDADYFIGLRVWDRSFPGCQIESLVANSYEICSYLLEYEIWTKLFPDIRELMEHPTSLKAE